MKRILLFTVTILAFFNLAAQIQLPKDNRAMFCPKYLMERDKPRKEWEAKIEKAEWGESSGRYWEVYSDRSDNYTYSSPSSSAPKYKVLQLMSDSIFRIARVENQYALIYREKFNQRFPKISENAESFGWIKLDHLLLWNSCPVDKHKIYDKGVVVNNLDEHAKGEDVDISPSFYTNPELSKPTGKEALKLEFYFIYKEIGNALLIAKENQIIGSTSERAVILGWISKKKIVPWNHRICLEPVWGPINLEKLSGTIKPAIFGDSMQALPYRQTGSMANVLALPPLGKKRMLPNSFRYPILSTSIKGIDNVVTIGSMSDTIERATAETLEKFEWLKKKQANINVVFVVDGTYSMKDYYRPIAEALERSSNKLGLSDRFKFGAVIYRDYIDDNEAIEFKGLTNKDNISEITTFLNQVNARSNPKDKDLPEALYYGLETALDTNKIGFRKDESNFIILVGDAGNHLTDSTSRLSDRVVKKLVDYSVNLIAFQANNGNEDTYTDFITQTMAIIRQTIYKAVGTVVDFKLSHPGYKETVLQGTNEKTIIVGGISFCDIGKSQKPENLEKLIENKIEEFNTQIGNWVTRLAKLINSQPGDWTPEIVQWMKNKGFTDSQIKILQGEQIKVSGYTSAKIINPSLDVFDFTTFLSKTEFDELIKDLEIVYKPYSPSRRKDFQDALKSLALSYVGQSNIDDYEVDEIMREILGGVPYVSNSLKGIKVRDIIEPRRLSEFKLESYMANFKERLANFEYIEKNKDYYFESNGQRYYWIPVDEMP